LSRRLITCNNYNCDNTILVPFALLESRDYFFCPECLAEHSHRALVAQAEHEKSIQEIIIDAAFFKTASNMAAYIGISFVTMYHWIKKYFDMSFQEFKRTYICKSDKCYLIDIKNSSYSRNDYVLKKIKNRRYCACLNSLEPNHIMTNAPLSLLQSIIRGRPVVERISDGFFSLGVTPVKDFSLTPIYSDINYVDGAFAATPVYSSI